MAIRRTATTSATTSAAVGLAPLRAVHGDGEQFYRVTHDGEHIADLDDFAALARWVPLHLLVDDQP